MKKLLILLFSLFLFSSPSIFADEILKIEGISLEDGQSILELFQKGEVTIDDLNALSLKAEEEAAERKKIADAKKIKDMNKAAERKKIADAKKVESKNNLMKLCPSCKEEIKHNANKCKHCGEIQDTLESREKILQQKQESLGEESRKSWINWWSTIIAIVGTWFLLTSDWYWDLFF